MNLDDEPPRPSAGPPPAEDAATEYARTLEALTPGVWLVPTMIGLNVLVFAIMVASGVSPMEPTVDGLIRWGADFGPLTTAGQWWRLLTSTFVHIGLFHIGMNMFVLWDIGTFMERLLGRGGFLVMYLFAGLAGSLASLAWNPFIVSAGASGAIFGLYGGLFAYLARFRHDIPTQSLARLQKGGLTFIGYNVVYGFIVQGIDISAHIGGLAGGFAIGLLLSHPPTAQAAGRRTALALRAAILACAAVVAVARVLPRTPDVDGAAKRFDAVEGQVIDATNAAVADWRGAKLDDEAFANRLERDVLSPWRAARESLAKLRGLPKLEQAFVTDLLRLADQRTAAWELLAAGARAHDGEKVRQAWRILTPATAARSGAAGNRGDGPPAPSSAPAASAGEWTAPDRPDPKKILDEARRDARAGHFEVALKKHLWFHRNALQFQRSLSAVRLSFALGAWFRLGGVYPPALVALRDTRDQALRTFRQGRSFLAFVDFAAINRTLGEEARTVEAFVALDRYDPATATQAFAAARPALIKARHYTLCGKYLKPKKDLSLALDIYRMDRDAAKDERAAAPEMRKFAEDRFTNETTTLVALLVVNGRDAEAKEIAKAVESEWNAPALHAAVEKALKGVVPEPWP